MKKVEKTIKEHVQEATKEKTFTAKFNQKELDRFVQICDIAVKATGLQGSVDPDSRYLISKFIEDK